MHAVLPLRCSLLWRTTWQIGRQIPSPALIYSPFELTHQRATAAAWLGGMQELLRFRFQLQFSFYFFLKVPCWSSGKMAANWNSLGGCSWWFRLFPKNKETCKTPEVAHRQTPSRRCLLQSHNFNYRCSTLNFFVTLPFSFSPRGHRFWQLSSDSDTHKTSLNNGQSHVLLFLRKCNNNKKDQMIMWRWFGR